MAKLFSIFGDKKTSQINDNTKKINYTKEIPYLPSYHWAQATNYTPSTPEEPFAKVEYLLHNVRDVQVYEDYRATLIEAGWTISDEMPVTKFSANKDSHEAHIWIIIVSGEGVLLKITTK